MAASMAAVNVALMKFNRTNNAMNIFKNQAIQRRTIIQIDINFADLRESNHMWYIGGKLSPTEFRYVPINLFITLSISLSLYV